MLCGIFLCSFDSNHALEFKFPPALIAASMPRQSQHEFSVRQSLYCFQQSQFRVRN
jgi:hypothetical protein